ncbi:unnamed protein product, partial [Darwinula stevensoni]
VEGLPLPATRQEGDARPIATGNWGCGSRSGDPQLKALIQWLAASMAQAPCLLYYTFGQPRLGRLKELTTAILARGWTVGQLCAAILQYSETSLIDFQEKTFSDCVQRMTSQQQRQERRSLSHSTSTSSSASERFSYWRLEVTLFDALLAVVARPARTSEPLETEL